VYYRVFLLIRVVCVASFKVGDMGDIRLALPPYATECEGECVAYAVVCLASCKVGVQWGGGVTLSGGGGGKPLALVPRLPLTLSGLSVKRGC
jgi:hypothetical protein